MDHTRRLTAQLDALFNPDSVAVVGVPRGNKVGKLFLMALMDQGFPGHIYPVHPQAAEIDGLRAYPSVSAIPEPVDLAIVLVPNHSTLSVVQECAAKGVKGAVLFTAGYKETGTDKGKALEEELVKVTRSSGMRVIGPNCMGFYSPKTGLSFFPELSRIPGHVGIISHSGSLGNILCRTGPQRGIYFSKVASLGNECDLTSTELLIYLGRDTETQIIGAYLEGIKNAPLFLDALQKVSLEKPVILWKAGLTPEGSRAAASHTGAMACSREIWEGVVRQGGAIPVVGFEAWVDALMGFSLLPAGLGDRMAIISGPGGLAVSAAEACAMAGLRLAVLSPETRSVLARLIDRTGTSFHNPIDIGLSGAMNVETTVRVVKTAAADTGVDAIVVIGTGITPEDNKQCTTAMPRIRSQFHKPIVMVTFPGFGLEHARGFYELGTPVFDSVERAMVTYAQVYRYQRLREKRALWRTTTCQ